ncbi:MAG: fumarylacetoacetate hydrolase family protein [Deltaproteobacteria bacterium]|nr:fumarylacetoacetate hydrolase family protein [Deltaproteobacteria bacterium]
MKSVTWDGKAVYPSKIVCVGRNYADHIKEFDNEASQESVIFIKPNSAISNEIHSSKSEVIHFEGEITFLISSGELRGVGFGLDLTKRDLQYKLKAKGWPWERAKAFDHSAVFSDFVTFKCDISELRMEFYINDALVQFGNYDLMLSKPTQMLNEAKSFLSFEDGDLLMTGTPKGVSSVNSGDKYLGKIFQKEKLIVEGSWVVK